jgi:hypothetical protein
MMGTTILSALPSLALAITITPTGDAFGLANTLFLNVPGLVVNSATLQGVAGGIGPSQAGTYQNLAGTYGLPVSGIVLSSGNVSDYATGPNTSTSLTTDFGSSATAEQEDLLFPITGVGSHFDAVQLDIEFVPLGVTSVTFFATFGSEEFPEFVNGGVNDGFGLYVNGVNVAGVLRTGGVAGDPLTPVNIDNPDMRTIAGTELDGILAPNNNPVLRFDVPVQSGVTNLFEIILADAGDLVVDTTVYLSSFIPTPGGGGGGGGGGGNTSGQNEFNPLLPSNPPDPVTGTFVIDFADVWQNFDEDDVIWIDPPVAVGYFYEAFGGALFTGVLAPSLASLADLDGYTITAGGMSIDIAAGELLDFSDWLGFDVASFTLSGIDPLLGLDPVDPAAFPVGVLMSGLSSQTIIEITPVTADVAPIPLPAGIGLYMLGLAGLGGFAVSRRNRHI